LPIDWLLGVQSVPQLWPSGWCDGGLSSSGQRPCWAALTIRRCVWRLARFGRRRDCAAGTRPAALAPLDGKATAVRTVTVGQDRRRNHPPLIAKRSRSGRCAQESPLCCPECARIVSWRLAWEISIRNRKRSEGRFCGSMSVSLITWLITRFIAGLITSKQNSAIRIDFRAVRRGLRASRCV